MCVLLHVTCRLWGRCVATVPCLREYSRLTNDSRLFRDVMAAISSALDESGRLRHRDRLKRAYVMARFSGWDFERTPVPVDMAYSVEGRTVLMLMVFDQVFRLWRSSGRHSSHRVVVEFNSFLEDVRSCFSSDGQTLCRHAALDRVLSRYRAIVSETI
jgi:hypothetical protein